MKTENQAAAARSHLGTAVGAARRRCALEVEPVADDPLHLRARVLEAAQLRIGRALRLCRRVVRQDLLRALLAEPPEDAAARALPELVVQLPHLDRGGREQQPLRFPNGATVSNIPERERRRNRAVRLLFPSALGVSFETAAASRTGAMLMMQTARSRSDPKGSSAGQPQWNSPVSNTIRSPALPLT